MDYCLLGHGKWAKYCNQRVCLSVSAVSHISKTTFSVHLVRVVLTDSNAIRYLLPVLQMTSRLHIIEQNGHNQRRHYLLWSSPDGATGGKFLSTMTD